MVRLEIELVIKAAVKLLLGYDQAMIKVLKVMMVG